MDIVLAVVNLLLIGLGGLWAGKVWYEHSGLKLQSIFVAVCGSMFVAFLMDLGL